MTWEQLLEHLRNMEKIGHSSMGKKILFDTSDGTQLVDLRESLITGDVFLCQLVVEDEDE